MGGVAAAGFAPTASAASKRNLRKAIMYSTIGVKGSVLEKFRVMKEAGFEGVEPMGAMNRDEVLAAFKETGLQAASVCDHIHWVKTLDEVIGVRTLLVEVEHVGPTFRAGSNRQSSVFIFVQ